METTALRFFANGSEVQ